MVLHSPLRGRLYSGYVAQVTEPPQEALDPASQNHWRNGNMSLTYKPKLVIEERNLSRHVDISYLLRPSSHVHSILP